MTRTTLAMTLGLGLGLALPGCGPTATPPAADTGTASPSATAETKPDAPKDGGAMAGAPAKGGGGGGGGGNPANITKGMESPGYRDASKSAEVKDKAEYASDKAKEEAEKTGGAGVPPASDKDKPKEKDADPKTAAVTLSADEVATLKKMPEPDQSAALAQKICPVGEDEDGKPNHLGAMGKPIKVDLKGKTAFVCCQSCVDDAKKDPEKALAKIGK